MNLTLLNLEPPTKRADYETNAPTGASLRDLKAMEQFLIGVKTHSGQTVTPEKARRCAAVIAIMRGISEDISSLPLPLFRRGKYGDEIATDHNVHRILNVAPNELMTPIEVREHILFDLILWGAFYNLKNFEDPTDPSAVTSVWPLQAGYVVRQWRELYWNYTDPVTGYSGSFVPDDVWRGTVMSPNGLDGYALTLLAREAIGLLIAAEEQAARLFSYGVQSDFTLSSDDEIDDDAKDQLRKSFMQRYSGSNNAWTPLILEGGLKASRIGLTAQESQYIEARKFQIEDVARVFRYPEVLLGSTSGKSSTYASAEQFFQSYTKHTLIPWATRIEQTINRDLLTSKEQAKYYAKHDFDQLLRADQSARFDAWNKAISGGWMQPAEARRREGWSYIEGLEYCNRAKNMDSLGGSNEPAPTDSSALGRRVAHVLLRKELKALTGDKPQNADTFYAHFGAYVGELTGAGAERVTAYLETRRTNADRFSTAAQETAIAALVNLCTKDTE